ncbi:hypothetical protein RB195_020738 [Necator americanus]|uniref:Reverse transcriptase domain-containing protein n=1 Tax=Necator americanus TaxID=51031 RepID=A0ABR1CK87_NECAM
MNGSDEVGDEPKKRVDANAPTDRTIDDELEDPFEDPALVTHAFLDIMWQDSHGNSALMLAAKENRNLHVKGILKMALKRGNLWQMLDMRNEDGLTALEIAVRAGSDSCAMLITRFAKEAQKTRASRRPFLLNAHPRRLSRDKLMNNLKRTPPSAVVLNMKRTWPPQNTIKQRTMSGNSLSSASTSPPSSSLPHTENNKVISVGEKLRSIFSSKKQTEPTPSAIRGPPEYKDNGEERRLHEENSYLTSTVERNISGQEDLHRGLTFIDLKKAFDSVETEAVVEALDNQWLPTQHIKVDGRQLHHLHFADDIVLITSSINQAERMLTEFDETCGCIGLQLNLQKTMFMCNRWVSDAPFTLNGTKISECSSYVYLGRELNMMNDLTPELGRRKRADWGAYKSIEDVVKKTRNTRLRAHLFNTTVLPALTYASETWAFRKQEENAVSVIERAIEGVVLGVSRFTQVRDGIRSSLLRQRSKIRDAAAFAKESKIWWAGHVMRFNDNRWTRAVSEWVPRDIKRTTGRPPTRWSDFFTKSFKENYDALRVPRERRNH